VGKCVTRKMEIERVKKEYEELLEKLSDPELISDWPTSTKVFNPEASDRRATAGKEKVDELRSSSRFANARVFEELLKRKRFIEQIIEKEKELKELKDKIEENKSIISAREDVELISLAETEIAQFQDREKILVKELKKSLVALESQPVQPCAKAVIVEIRAGTGGEEAALFAANLFKMYSKYGQSLGCRQKVLESRPTGLGGLKEIIFELSNGDVFSKMKYEAGVHRVQRIPQTEKVGRIHTSTASVAVLPKPKKTEIKIRPEDLRIDFYRASGPGGQYVNKRETAVRITHLSTGLVVTSQTERNQLQNKENAMAILEAKLLARKEEEELQKIGGKRKAQIGWAKRAEKIRTYNFPQDRVTDHRIEKSFHDIEGIINGKLKPIIQALQKKRVKQNSQFLF